MLRESFRKMQIPVFFCLMGGNIVESDKLRKIGGRFEPGEARAYSLDSLLVDFTCLGLVVLYNMISNIFLFYLCY